MINHDPIELGEELIEKVLDRKCAPEICKECANSKREEECWFYWEKKKDCPQFSMINE